MRNLIWLLFYFLDLAVFSLILWGELRRAEKERRELYDRLMAKNLSEFRACKPDIYEKAPGRLRKIRESWRKEDGKGNGETEE